MKWQHLPPLVQMQHQRLLPNHLLQEATLIESGRRQEMSDELYLALCRLNLLGSLNVQEMTRH